MTSNAQEIFTRSASAFFLGAAVLFITHWHPTSFAAMCAIGAALLWGEWRKLTAARGTSFLIGGGIYICLALFSLIILRHIGAFYVYALFALVWGGDIAAYVVGKAIGRHKIAPSISPGKSWEGLFASIAATSCIMIYIFNYGGFFVPNPHFQWVIPAILGLLFAVVGLLGDLYESSLKRHAGVKDSGNLIPGHGGLFDRVDALLPCAILAMLLVAGTMLVHSISLESAANALSSGV